MNPVVSSDGTKLFRRSWNPSAPKATVVVVHGLKDHGGRYAELAERLVGSGNAVVAADLRGHGLSMMVQLGVAPPPGQPPKK